MYTLAHVFDKIAQELNTQARNVSALSFSKNCTFQRRTKLNTKILE